MNTLIYFGSEWEVLTHIGLHLIFGLILGWKQSAYGAVWIEGADAFNGRNDWLDWISRLAGAGLAYGVKWLWKKFYLTGT